MAVPARPLSGVPIETAWGQVAHDTAVAMDIQAGTASIVVNAAQSNTVTITFPRPFASAPILVAAVGPLGTSLWVCQVHSVTATQAVLNATTKTAATSSATVPIAWIAYGPRA